jgi:hypothetical protein
MPDSRVDESLRVVTELRRSTDRLNRLLELASKGRYLAIAPMLKKDPGIVTNFIQEARVAAAIDADQLLTVLQEAIDESKLRFQHDFEEACKQRGWEVGGQWPTYILGGILSVRVDLRTQRITIGARSLPSLDIDSAISAIGRMMELLIDRPFESGPFLDDLLRAYHDVVEKLHLGPAQFAPILEIYKRVSPASGEYSPEAFGIDLSKLLRDPQDSRRIELSAARGSRGAIFVPLPIRGGFISGIKPAVDRATTANG